MLVAVAVISSRAPWQSFEPQPVRVSYPLDQTKPTGIAAHVHSVIRTGIPVHFPSYQLNTSFDTNRSMVRQRVVSSR